MCLSKKLEIPCRTKKETILSYIIYEWIASQLFILFMMKFALTYFRYLWLDCGCIVSLTQFHNQVV